ncbi:MAG: hypothetical protein JXA25_19325 [Anaerolineales bacterium]|nr:hypothetical protein [Anaerolineales bacterium]
MLPINQRKIRPATTATDQVPAIVSICIETCGRLQAGPEISDSLDGSSQGQALSRALKNYYLSFLQLFFLDYFPFPVWQAGEPMIFSPARWLEIKNPHPFGC